MKRYTYSAKIDSTQESIGIVVAHDHENAIQLAAKKKNLDVDTFITLYVVNEVKAKKLKNEYIQ